MSQMKLFTKEMLKERVEAKAEERYPVLAERYTGQAILEQVGGGSNLAFELALEVLCEEINEVRKELRRKI